MDPVTALIYAVAMLAVSFAITATLSQKNPSQPNKPLAMQDFDFPTVEEGTPQSVVFGDVWSGDWMVLWYGNFRTTPVIKKIKTGGLFGGSKKQVVGYRYFFDFQAGISRGPINNLREIRVGDRTVFAGRAPGSIALDINQPNLFGGDEKEGGIIGTIWMFAGASNQFYFDFMKALLGGPVPEFRGIYTCWFTGQISTNNAYPKTWTFRLSRFDAGWDRAPWYPAKALIHMDPSAGHNSIEAMNPAHIIYECLTNRSWGRGFDPSWLDEDSFVSAANTLCNEMFGLCIRWTRQESIDEFISSIIVHIGAALYIDRGTGLWTLRLIRDDYDVNTLPTFDYDSGLLSIQEDESGGNDSTFNEIIVTYVDPISGQERQVRAHNLAMVQGLGGEVLSGTRNYPGIPTASLAARVARRDLETQSGFQRRFKLRLDRRGWKIAPGAAFRISATDYGISNIVLRAGSIRDSVLTEGHIEIDAVQDVFGLPATGYEEADLDGGWSPPNLNAQAATVVRVEEITYRELVRQSSSEAAASFPVGRGAIHVFAVSPASISTGYDLATAGPSESYEVRAEAGFTPTLTLSTAVGPYDTALEVVVSVPGTSQVAIGDVVLVGDEFMRVDAVDVNRLTVARGCIDTIPEPHNAGAVVWLIEDGSAVDGLRDYADAAVVNVKVLTKTPAQILALADAPVDSITIDQRVLRPYPAGNLTVNGEPFASITSVATSEVLIEWAHRDRLAQGFDLVEHGAASIGPEAGVTYTIRVYDGVTLLRTASGISGDDWTYTSAMITADGEPTLDYWTFEHEAVRAGLTSWRKYSFQVPRRRAVSAAPGAGTWTVVGYRPDVDPAVRNVAVGAGSLTVRGFQAGGATIDVGGPATVLEVEGYAPTVGNGFGAAPGAGGLSLAGYAPTAP